MGNFIITEDSVRHGKKIAALLEAEISRVVGKKPRDVALMLSGGMDSAVAGMAVHNLGHRVHSYTFQLGSKPSFDSKHAATVARTMGWSWKRVVLPTATSALIRAWPVLYNDLKCRKKREFECAWPFLYLYPQVEEKHTVNGLFADAYFYLTRKAYKMGASGPNSDKAVLDQLRREYFLPILDNGYAAITAENNPACLSQHLIMQRAAGHVNLDPYLQRPLFNYMMKLSWQELNMPRQKHVLAGAYPTWVEAVGHRNHRSYQTEGAGGISPHFEALLATPINFRKRSRPIDMYGDWRRYGDEADAVIRRIEDHYGHTTLADYVNKKVQY